MIEYKSPILYIVITILLMALIIIDCLFKNKSNNTKKLFLFVASVINLIIHFIKIIYKPMYGEFPSSLFYTSFYNICSISVLLLPFLIYGKDNSIKNFIMTMSVLGGIGALIFTGDIYSRDNFIIDSIRYIFCHLSLFIIGFFGFRWKITTAKYKYILIIPFLFILESTLIFLDTYFFFKIGLIECSEAEFWSQDYYNFSLVFGPRSSFEGLMDHYGFLVPKIFRTNYWSLPCLGNFYLPVLWEIVLDLTVVPLSYFVFALLTKTNLKNK